MTDFDNKPELADELENLPEIAQAEYFIDYPFKDKALLYCALTHSSIEPDPSKSYERLEFFGDRILGMVLSDWLYQAFPQADQGELTNRFHALARQEYLAGICTKLEMQNCLLHEKGSKRLAERPSVQADLIEAIIAALYLDGGLAAAASFIKSHWQVKEAIPDVLAENPKSALQEWAQARGMQPPDYNLLRTEGPPHDAVFTVEAVLPNGETAQAQGRSKRSAEQAAAKTLLARMEARNE